MMQNSSISLGELIIVRDEVNKHDLDLPVIGINRDKEFMPTVANVTEVDTKKYKIVRKGDFVFSGMQTGRDVCIRIGLYTEDHPSLISPAYTTFTIDESKGVLSEFFFMYFNRFEMDRYGWFISDSSVRSNLDWPRFLEIIIPKPDVNEQRNYVAIWNDLRRMKEDNHALASPLFQLCQSKIQELKHELEPIELGPYIRQCDARNDEEIYGVEYLRGVTSDGVFDKSKAKTDGLTFNNYKIVNNGDFAYNPSRINLGSIAKCEEICIISPMYVVFRLNDRGTDAILPEYLNIWFRRSEFQRSTLFYASGSVRDTFSFTEMQRVRIPIPDKSVQQAIVDIFNCAQEANRISNEADKLSRDICPALMQKAIDS